MGRLDAFRTINRDETLKEEILTRISEDPLWQNISLNARRRLRPVRNPAASARVRFAEPGQRRRGQVGDRGSAGSAIRLRPGGDHSGDGPAGAARPERRLRPRDPGDRHVEDQAGEGPARAEVGPFSVGRVDLDNNPRFDWVGTGWVVSDDRRHQPARRGRVRPPGGGRLRLPEVRDGPDGCSDRLQGGVPGAQPGRVPGHRSAPHRGCAGAGHGVPAGRLGDWDQRAPIRLAASTETGRGVAVIGYPAKDSRTRIPDEMDRIFGSVYNVKRLAPGDVTAVSEQEQLVNHDCTTLGGNSGSAVLDLETGEAVALHFAGRETATSPFRHQRFEPGSTRSWAEARPGGRLRRHPPSRSRSH